MAAKQASARVIRPEQWKPSRPIRRKINLRTPQGKINKHWVTVEHTENPKETLFAKIGPLPDSVVQGSRILVAIYQPPMVTKTAGGIILTDAMSEDDYDEYVWQGKVGMIVAMGEKAYVDDDTMKFGGLKNEIGDWVWFMPSDGQAVYVNEVPCRRFNSEGFIAGKIPHPDYIW